MSFSIGEASDSLQKKTVLFIQSCIGRPLRLLLYLADKKRGSPSFLKKLVAGLVVPLVTLGLTKLGVTQTTPQWWHSTYPISYSVSYSFVLSIFGAIVMFFLLEATLPMLFYAPTSVSMRSMGLLYTEVMPDSVQKVITREIERHKAALPIKAICISGSTLFAVPRSGSGEAPFSKQAAMGKLQILMPKSSALNPTIAARYATYDSEYKHKNYPSIDDLVREIDKSKQFLKLNQRNVVVEHDALIMWRVIIMSHCCIVQNYFPNHSGEDSDDSPVFVFEKTSPKCRHSYYSTFDDMFHLLSGLPRTNDLVSD